MSAKGRRSNAWDDAHLKGVLTPVKWLLRALSSITLAVLLLVLVMLYGISASVPAGILALAPTYVVVGVTLLIPMIIGLLIARAIAKRIGDPAKSFLALVVGGVVLLIAAISLWSIAVWPMLRYDPITGAGLRFFPEFVREHSATTLRRLPGLEMSELEYYSWWPLRVVLLLFVVNMVVATVRRIDFTFRNIGVLTVHTGIVTIALGSVYYSGLKLEGDALLLAGNVDEKSGTPGAGPPVDTFYDNTDVVLYASQGRGWEQRLLRGVPRYNAYGLDAFAGDSAWEASGRKRPWGLATQRTLDVNVPDSPTDAVDPDIRFRIVGYAPYATSVRDWKRAEPAPGEAPRPLRLVYLHTSVGVEHTREDELSVTRESPPAFAFTLPPTDPVERTAVSKDQLGNPVLSVEFLPADQTARWRDVCEELPEGTIRALVIEVGGTGVLASRRSVVAISEGTTSSLAGYTVTVEQLLPEPPFPIITEGYRGATSSVAVVRITKPDGAVVQRYVYHRFPEIAQDLSTTQLNDRGMPLRSDADPAIRLSLIEADHLAIYLKEHFEADGRAVVRAAVREPGGKLRVVEESAGWLDQLVPKISLKLGPSFPHARRAERPSPVPEHEQDKADVGTHARAMIAVEARSSKLPQWRDVVWIPFSRYMGFGNALERTLTLPDGRVLTLAFGRLQHKFPGFAVQLADFTMLSYDHRGAPRDYQSTLRVLPTEGGRFDAYEHVSKLNEPLRAPWMWNNSAPWFTNALGRVRSGLSPNQFKLSQAGWDRSGWQQSQAQADAGLIKRPFAKFTILGVGNNPGIHVIALGGVLMGLGIPWAFYVKPYLVRREKRRLQAIVAATAGEGGENASQRRARAPMETV